MVRGSLAFAEPNWQKGIASPFESLALSKTHRANNLAIAFGAVRLVMILCMATDKSASTSFDKACNTGAGSLDNPPAASRSLIACSCSFLIPR